MMLNQSLRIVHFNLNLTISHYHRSVGTSVQTLYIALFYYFIIPLFHIKYGLYTAYDLIKGLPGIVLIFVLVPIIVPRALDVLNRYSLRLYEDKKEGRDGHP